MSGPVALGDSLYLQFGTSSATTGAATNADSTPTATVREDGAAMGYAPTVTNLSTGLYQVQIDCTGGNGFEAGKRYSVHVSATVGGVSGSDGIDEFEVLATDLNTALDTNIGSRLATAGYTAPDNATIALIYAAIDTEIGAIKAKTDNLPANPAAAGDQMALTAAAIDAILDDPVDGGYTLRQLLRGFASALMAKLSGADLNAPAFRDLADTKNRISAITDAAGNRTAVTLDLT